MSAFQICFCSCCHLNSSHEGSQASKWNHPWPLAPCRVLGFKDSYPGVLGHGGLQEKRHVCTPRDEDRWEGTPSQEDLPCRAKWFCRKSKSRSTWRTMRTIQKVKNHVSENLSRVDTNTLIQYLMQRNMLQWIAFGTSKIPICLS